MQPIHELLHRIKWDPEFGKGEFVLGYEDRLAGGEVLVPMRSIGLDPGSHSFSVNDGSDSVAHVPLHRVHTVYKDGVTIWRRPPLVPSPLAHDGHDRGG